MGSARAVVSARTALALAVLALAGSPSVALADAAQARVHFDKGKTYFEVDEYRKAIDEFKAAHVEKADPAFLYNIAECYRHLGETHEALVYYRRFLSLSPANDRTRATVEKRIAELQSSKAGSKPPRKELEPAVVEPARAPVVAPSPVITAAPIGEPPAATLIGEPQPARGAPVDEPRPLYKKGWFIATVAAVVVGGAVAVWALSRGSDIPATPLGNQPVFQ
jgi:hypothetical protein